MDVLTFEDDLLDLAEFANRFEKFISVEQHFVPESLVLALSSRFGTGKTTFLRMWRASLEARDRDDDPLVIIMLNAWESDYYGDPLFAILSNLIEALQSAGEQAKPIIDAAKDVGWFVAAIGNQIAAKVAGIDAMEAGAFAEKKKNARNSASRFDAFSTFEQRKMAMSHLQSVIGEFINSSNLHVLFLVDELDRCRPDYAISYLETIKHIFDVRGATFVLAADRNQLENSAKTAFGSDLDFDEYYRKFIHREVSLPAISESGYKKMASAYVREYLERDGLRNCFMELDGYRIENIVELVSALRLTPRQIQEVFRILGHVFATSQANRGRLLWCIAAGTIAMAALKVADRYAYESFGYAKFKPKDAFAFLSSLFADRHLEWWFTLFLTGDGMEIPEGTSAMDMLVQVGLIEESAEQSQQDALGQWRQGWGHSSRNRCSEIREKIDEIVQWK
ncbi:MAG TPA: P-loop NTPase fold protein [Gammaproteobacteria bacterium]|nr:P-loop NTPase fold protein [Gammaproteobacteria bacterium]